MSQANDAIMNLTAGWYSVLTTSLSLDESFQLMQGNDPLGTTSDELWRVMDIIPPDSCVFIPTGHSGFSDEYHSVIMNLKAQGSEEFKQILGDSWAEWDSAKGDLLEKHKGNEVAAFEEWALGSSLDPSKASQAKTSLRQKEQDAVSLAVDRWFKADDPDAMKPYATKIEQVRSQCQSAPSGQANFDSEKTSSNVEKIRIDSSLGISYDLFSFNASGSYDSLTSKVSSSKLTVDVSFDHFFTVDVTPLSSKSGGHVPWYYGPALDLAYKNNDNNVWKNSAPTWEDKFGEHGSLRRVVGALVIVDGIQATITSEADLDEDDHKTVEAQLDTGYFPFFQASGKGGWENNIDSSDSGKLVVTTKCKGGNPQILGVNVIPIDEIFQ